jgi:hypothetical protein
MHEPSNNAFTKRQAQWDAFNQWEMTRQPAPLSLEERVDWYISADRFSRSLAATPIREDVLRRVKQIQLVRERLAHLRRA